MEVIRWQALWPMIRISDCEWAIVRDGTPGQPLPVGAVGARPKNLATGT